MLEFIVTTHPPYFQGGCQGFQIYQMIEYRCEYFVTVSIEKEIQRADAEHTNCVLTSDSVK